MSRKILIITVGGSHKPVVKSIEQNQPDFVYFICSDDSSKTKGSYITVIGEGNVCGGNFYKNEPPNERNIVIQTDLDDENYEVVRIQDPDNINDCFNHCLDIIDRTILESKSNKVIIDYTGGTKSMSSALILAASNYPDIKISLVAGDRNNLQKTIDGTEQLSLISVNKAYLNQYLLRVEAFFERRDYDSVTFTLEKLTSNYADIPQDIRSKINTYISKSKFFSHWDKFEHKEAYKSLHSKELKVEYKNYIDALRRIVVARSKMDDMFIIDDIGLTSTLPVTGFEIVQDLILNAKRKAQNDNFDDATARIYRALEVFVQVYLKNKYDIFTSDIDLDKLPDGDFKNKLKLNTDNKKIQTGLTRSYEMLGILDGNDVVFRRYEENKQSLLQVLQARNNSILAHGFQSIDRSKFKDVKKYAVDDFLMPLIVPELEKTSFSLNQFPEKL